MFVACQFTLSVLVAVLYCPMVGLLGVFAYSHWFTPDGDQCLLSGRRATTSVLSFWIGSVGLSGAYYSSVCKWKEVMYWQQGVIVFALCRSVIWILGDWPYGIFLAWYTMSTWTQPANHYHLLPYGASNRMEIIPNWTYVIKDQFIPVMQPEKNLGGPKICT